MSNRYGPQISISKCSLSVSSRSDKWVQQKFWTACHKIEYFCQLTLREWDYQLHVFLKSTREKYKEIDINCFFHHYQALFVIMSQIIKKH